MTSIRRSPFHVVIVPRDHVATLNEVGDGAVVGRLAAAAAALAKSGKGTQIGGTGL